MICHHKGLPLCHCCAYAWGTLQSEPLFKQHPVFSQNPHPLQIIAYNEVEVCNPLGTHVKQHKLGIVFYTLGNIYPNFRSSLQVINSSVCDWKVWYRSSPTAFHTGHPFLLHRGLAWLLTVYNRPEKVHFWLSWQIILPVTTLEVLTFLICI